MFTLELAGGVTVHIGPLWLEETYAGLLEGYPTRRLNDAEIASVPERAARLFPGQPFFLARPYITHVPPSEGSRGSFPHEELPRILCIGLARELDGLHIRTMALAWFQNAPAPPVPREVVEELALVDWRGLAKRTEI